MPNERRDAAGDLDELARSLRRLDDRVRRWSSARWAGRGKDGRSRTDAARALAVTLADLGRLAGNGAPAEPPPSLQPHGIADQLLVLGRELQEAPQAAAHASAGTAAVERFLSGL